MSNFFLKKPACFVFLPFSSTYCVKQSSFPHGEPSIAILILNSIRANLMRQKKSIFSGKFENKFSRIRGRRRADVCSKLRITPQKNFKPKVFSRIKIRHLQIVGRRRHSSIVCKVIPFTQTISNSDFAI